MKKVLWKNTQHILNKLDDLRNVSLSRKRWNLMIDVCQKLFKSNIYLRQEIKEFKETIDVIITNKNTHI
jgi:hypothetical protein